MTRDEAIELIKKYDHVKPKDIVRWLNYTEMSEDEFNRIADSFRDPRVWWKEKRSENKIYGIKLLNM